MYVASHCSIICNGYVVIVQLFVMVQWMWCKLMRIRNTKYCTLEVAS